MLNLNCSANNTPVTGGAVRLPPTQYYSQNKEAISHVLLIVVVFRSVKRGKSDIQVLISCVAAGSVSSPHMNSTWMLWFRVALVVGVGLLQQLTEGTVSCYQYRH